MVANPLPLEGKVLLVTGALPGIGKSIAMLCFGWMQVSMSQRAGKKN